MKTTLLLTFLAIATLAHAQEAPAELAPIRDTYLRAVTAIRANAETRTKPVVTSYLAALDRMLTQVANDPLLSVSVTQERERVAAGKTPTAEEVAKMTVQLQQLRAKFDADMLQTKAPFVQQEAQYSRQYLTTLGTLQRRFTSQNAIAKAAFVQAEAQKVNAELGVIPAGEKAKPKADSTVTAGTVKALGALEAGFADKLAAAAKAKAYVRTANSKQGAATAGAIDVPDDGGLLVGFEFFQHGKDNWIRSVRPYFLTRQGIVAGKDRGKMLEVTEKIMARPGYAVAGMLISEGKEIQLIFMKINSATASPMPPTPTRARPTAERAQKRRSSSAATDGS